jgi:uncharacterized protein (TIGR02145 family)
MSWKINGKDLKTTYGVYVAKSSNILDLAPWQDRLSGTDWLDQNGKEYWYNYVELKYEDREIVLNCWISVKGGYAAFFSAVQAFYDAITGKDVTLVTPLGTVTGCRIENGIQMVRETNYVRDRQVGSFVLRITKAGSRKTTYIGLYNSAGSSKLSLYSDNIKVSKRMQGEATVSMTVEHYNPLNIVRGDFVLLGYNGTSNEFTEKWYMGSTPECRKVSTNKYVYNLRFDHYSAVLKEIAFRSDNEEGDFYWFTDMTEIVTKIQTIVNAVYPSLIGSVEVDATVKRNHKFTNENCWDVLQRIASEYNLEWDFTTTDMTPSGAGQMKLSVKTLLTHVYPYTLEYGYGKGLYELTRQQMIDEELVTELYAWGSDKNLKADYIYRRLKCPTMPLVSTSGVAAYGRIQKHMNFDDIYPSLSASAESYYQLISVTGERATIGTEYEETDLEVYRIGASLPFDPTDEEHLLGTPPKVRMITGNLAGFEFEVKRYVIQEGNGYIFIAPNEDQYAGRYPSSTIYPASGDTFTLVDIKQDASYVTDAEATLLAAATNYLNDHDSPKITYKAVINPSFISAMRSTYPTVYPGFNTGDTVTITDADLGSSTQRVSELNYDITTRQTELTLSEKRVLTSREQYKLRLANVEKAVKGRDQDTVEKERKDQETTAELRNRIYNTGDYKFDTDTNLRNETLDPRTFAYDAGVPQFVLYGLLVSTNWEKVANRVHVTAGGIRITNWALKAETRVKIKEILDDGGKYDPVRTWTIPETTLNLPTAVGYWLYAKLPRDEALTVGSITYCTELRLPKYYPGYITYTLGYVNPVSSPRVATMLWGNVKMTGDMIESALDPRLFANGKTIYMHNDASSVSGYHQALITQPEDTYAEYTASGASGEVLLAKFITDPGVPGGSIPGGPWVFESYAAVTWDDECYLKIDVSSTDASGGSETELFSASGKINDVIIARFDELSVQGQFELAADARLSFTYTAVFESTTPHTMILSAEGDTESAYFWTNVNLPDNGLMDGTSGLSTVYTKWSVTGDGASGSEVRLVGDEAAPGASKYYGTDAASALGYHDLPASGSNAETFLDLTDTPSAYIGQSGKLVAVASGEGGLVFVDAASGDDNYVDGISFDSGTRMLTLTRTGSLADLTVEIPDASGGGADTFLDLTDTPSAYTGQAGKYVAVASGEGGVEFVDSPSGSDNYVDGATFSTSTRDLTLTRTGDLEDITVNIPCCNPVDVIGGTTYPDIKYGALYNWWAATDVRNIAPAGWHVPTDSEIETLRLYVASQGWNYDGTTDIGQKWNNKQGKALSLNTGFDYSAEVGSIGNTDYANKINVSGFNAIGSGERNYVGSFQNSGKIFAFYSSTENDATTSRQVSLYYSQTRFYIETSGINKKYGYSIRLLKDDTTNTGTMVGNDGKVYPTVKIGNQVWMAANSAETKYRNGDLISNHGETYADKYTNAEWAALTTEAMCWYDDNIENGYTDVAVIQHNAIGGIQGGSTTERYHHTKDEIDTHVYATGASGSFTTADSKTVTVVNGIITDIT